MPTYEYKCERCGFRFEIYHKINETLDLECTKCNSCKLKKGVGGGLGIHFKGSGFYETDYKNK